MLYNLYYEGELLLEQATQAEIYAAVQERVANYERMYEEKIPDYFFDSFEVLKPVDFQFEKFLTTAKRDTFPKTYSVEGNNFID